MSDSSNVFNVDLEDEFIDDGSVKIHWHAWRRLLGFLLQHRRECVLVCICGALTGGLEMTHGLIVKAMLDDIEINQADANLWLWATLFLSVSILLATAVMGFVRFTLKVRAYAAHDLREVAFRNTHRQSFAFFNQRPVGWLMARLTADCNTLTNILAWALLDLVWGTTMMLTMSIAMYVINWKLALIATCTLPVFAYLSVKFRFTILRSARIVRAANSRITGKYNESIMGVLTSKTFALEESNLRDFQNHTTTLYLSSVKYFTTFAVYFPLVMVAASVGVAFTTAIGGMDLIVGAITASTLVLFLMWSHFFFEPMTEMATHFAEMQMAQASAERVLSVVDAQPDISDRHLTPSTTVELGERVERVELNHVGFEYLSGSPVLDDINLTVQSGESIALVGPTGAGKSTLVNLICRYYEPTAGSILVNGVDYRRFRLHQYRSSFGVVLQRPHTFAGTVMENIRYGRLDASDEEVIAVAKTAGAHEFIEQLENGYRTETGAGGSRLSTGQKQLISIARALLADPEVLVLDEATSSIDTETERKIQAGLSQLLKDRISFVIAHRLSTIFDVDRIAYIDHGRIIEAGSHQELLVQNGRYANLYRQQSTDESFTASLKQLQKQRITT